MYAEDKLPHFHSGKVRETKLVPRHPGLLLPIATDRFSTHNVVHKSEIPGKGELLTAQMMYLVINLLDQLRIPHHVIAWGKRIYDYLPKDDYSPRFHYRALIVQRLTMAPIEFVFRNYLAGSLERLYKAGEDPYGHDLPKGLKKMHHFYAPVFTPTDKSATDDPLKAIDVMMRYPHAYRTQQKLFIGLTDFLRARGLILIDHKGEGSMNGMGTVADEFGTGDCSRLAREGDVIEGQDARWLDKENGRVIAVRKWGGKTSGDPLEFTPDEIRSILDGYHEAFEAITGQTLSAFQKQYFD